VPDLTPEPIARQRRWARCAECTDPVYHHHGDIWLHENGWHRCSPASNATYATPDGLV